MNITIEDGKNRDAEPIPHVPQELPYALGRTSFGLNKYKHTKKLH